jgi:hypothetical protein
MPEIVVGRDQEDLTKYRTKATLYIGKHLVGTGEDAHLTTPLLVDAIRPHIILLAGKRGSGKSYSLSVIAEELTKLPDEVRRNLCTIMIDTQGIFWTMKQPNEQDLELLRQWNIEPKGFNASVYIPKGQTQLFEQARVDFDGAFSISPTELTIQDWLSTFSLQPDTELALTMQKILAKPYLALEDIITNIQNENITEQLKASLINRFEAAKAWGIFAEGRMPPLLEPGKLTILDISLTPWNIRNLLLSLVLNKLFIERTKARRREELEEARFVPMPWIFIDEAHNFLPTTGETAASQILQKIIKEGRQPGLSLVLATQQPEKLHQDVLAQTDLLISHRLTTKADIDALRSIMQTYMFYDIQKYMNELPKWKGVGLILDDNSERIYKLRTRPKQSWHAGGSPKAL